MILNTFKLFTLATFSLMTFFAQANAQHIRHQNTIVHLFEWRWDDIAKECEKFLGPKGFYGVQISPPQEHIMLDTKPWYERYQVVSYKLESRSGNRQQFAEMINRCNQAGVKIFADAVINHMSDINFSDGRDKGIGTGGSHYQRYNYPGTYSPNDFNQCNKNGYNSPIINYSDRWEVQFCNLVTLADLKTSSDYVRYRIAAYLNDLISLGVSGFRVDGAKHIPAEDLQAIYARLDRPVEIYQEVIDYGHEPVSAWEYVGLGSVTEMRFGSELSRVLRTGKLDWLKQFGHSWGFLRDEHAMSFIDNHDTQRGYPVLTYKESSLYAMANIFMLAWPYGSPVIMSSYAFSEYWQGPPTQYNSREIDPVYNANDQVQCFGKWICEHRWIAIANMVHFRKAVGSQPVTNWWSNGNNQIAFGRQGKGFAVFNNEDYRMQIELQTDLPAGKYCDITTGSYKDQNCRQEIYIQANGKAYFDVPPRSSVAVHIEEKN